MGIPHLFRHFARRCPRAIQVVDASSSSSSFTELHIDFNSVIHSCAREVIRDVIQEHASSDDVAATEIRIVDACMAHVAWLVVRFRPSALVHVAVDGAPPRAKMSQQRSRRYLKHLQHPFVSSSPPSPLWDSNVVTPGTPFMHRLDEALHASLESRIRDECVRRSVPPPQRVLVSGSDEPGEGEQKIFMGLRRGNRGGGKCGVYGLDADLLLMSMAHPLWDRLVILREQDLKGPVQLVDVAVLAKHAASEIAKLRWDASGPAGTTGPAGADDKESAEVAEYVALCTLLGNDFVPSLPSLSIRHGGIDDVLAAYGRAIRHGGASGSLARGGPTALAGFNLTVLSAVVHELSEHEDRALETRERHHASALVAASKKRTPTEDDYPLLPSSGPHPMVYPGVPGWRPRYYRQVFFAGRGSISPTQSDVDETCIEYVMALAWSFAYLSRQECVSVGWHYRHPHAPTALDVRKALLGNELAVGGSPFAPSGIAESAFRLADQLHRQGERTLGSAVWQLLHVLPPQTIATLFSPSSLAGRIATDPRLGCVHLFPSSFGLVTYLKEKLHECVPVIPEIDPKLLIRAVAIAL